jgi:hypothetical protein
MIIDFFNIWAREIPKVADSIIIRYEDMRAQPAKALGQVLTFVGTPGTESEIKDAVDYAAYENMKKLETEKRFRTSGARLIPGDRDNPSSFKVRRAKVGGYRDYFDEQQARRIDEMVARLDPIYGYTASGG